MNSIAASLAAAQAGVCGRNKRRIGFRHVSTICRARPDWVALPYHGAKPLHDLCGEFHRDTERANTTRTPPLQSSHLTN
jgi:hypothetical protein